MGFSLSLSLEGYCLIRNECVMGDWTFRERWERKGDRESEGDREREIEATD